MRKTVLALSILGWSSGLIACGSGYRAKSSAVAASSPAPEAEKTPAPLCEGEAFAGNARVVLVATALADLPAIPGRGYAIFDFLPIGATSSTRMTLSLTQSCLVNASLRAGWNFNATAWIRSAGVCHPYVLSIPHAACVDQF